jgi:CheY-like chemotaxis protein
MTSKIEYRGFNPPEELARNFENSLQRVSELCPSDSTIAGWIEERNGEFVSDISIRHQRGHVAISCQEPLLKTLYKRSLDALHERIRIWRQSRFLIPFDLHDGGTIELMAEHATAGAFARNKPRVLIVEDDPAALRVLDAIFERAGYETTTVSSAFEAIRELSFRPSRSTDLVVLDWYLPYMEGDEVLRRADSSIAGKTLYEGRGFEPIPVVTCSGLPSAEIRFGALKHFVHVGHWEKGLPFSTALSNAVELLPRISGSRAA